MQECYLPTGNEWVSLPTLQACTGALESFSFLHMGHKGLIEQRGGASLPLMTPFFETEGERASLQSLTWGRKSNWIPTFCGTAGSLAVEGMLLAPVGERGFLYQLTVRSTSISRCPLLSVWKGAGPPHGTASTKTRRSTGRADATPAFGTTV